MRAMQLQSVRSPLKDAECPTPAPREHEVLLRIHTCAVCRTDLHVVDGELPRPKLPLVPGHEIVGTVVDAGASVRRWRVGDRLGVPWLGWTCGECDACRHGLENLCERALFTGYTIDGGYAEYVAADEQYCFAIPSGYTDTEAAPLLCAGLIGYRAYRKAGRGEHLGLYGFGAAAHIIDQVARHQGMKTYAFTRPGDEAGKAFALSRGATWAGGSDAKPPHPLDAAIIFAPVGALVPAALRAVRKGGTVVCAGIHMSDIPSFPYELLWEERKICSVANLTRTDGEEFLSLAPGIPVRVETSLYELGRANEALSDLRAGRVKGAAVLTVAHSAG